MPVTSMAMLPAAASFRSGVQSRATARKAAVASPVVCAAQIPCVAKKALAMVPQNAGKVAGAAVLLAAGLAVPELMHAAPAMAIEHVPYERLADAEAASTIIVKVQGNPSQDFLKVFYMAFLTTFGISCFYFGSLEDPYYETKYYRGEGGDGSQHWFYDKADRLEKEAREELLEKLGPKELPAPAEKKKSFV